MAAATFASPAGASPAAVSSALTSPAVVSADAAVAAASPSAGTAGASSATSEGDGDVVLTGVASLDAAVAGRGDLVFMAAPATAKLRAGLEKAAASGSAAAAIISRCMVQEVAEGRGAGPEKDYVLLDCTHLGAEVLETKLPDITEFARTYLGVDPVHEPVPVMPTAHYAMGGIPTNTDAEVLKDNTTVIPGLYAAGECACVSVHGSNRLGTNSLLDINVFGKRAGRNAAEYANKAKRPALPKSAEQFVVDLVDSARTANGSESVAAIRKELQIEMDRNAQVFRTEESLGHAEKVIKDLRKRYAKIGIHDRGQRFNTDLLEAIELGFLLDLAEVVVVSARNRKESRGGHMRDDFPDRDDKKFMQHTMAYKKGDSIALDWKPVVITNYPPMERKY